MCRNIVQLFNFDPPATEEEIHNAALQFIRKISGFSKPSKTNEASFYLAVKETEAVINQLLDNLVTNAKPRNREVELEKRRKLNEKRFGKRS